MRLTLAQLKASRIPEALNIAPTDSRFVKYVNEATERLLHMGHWIGTVQKLRMTASSGIITMPPQVATIEKFAVNSEAIPIRDYWYEFIGDGFATQNADSNWSIGEALFKGYYPTFADIVPGGKLVKVVCDLSADAVPATRKILVLGYDDNNNWIRTQVGGVWQDGEYLTLAQVPGSISTSTFSSITDIQLPDGRSGQCWLYEHTAAADRLIGQYQYWETNPNYARYFIPSIGPTNTATVEAMAKLAFVPVMVDTDFVIIGNMGALKLGCMAVKAEEEHRWDEAQILWYGGVMKDGTRRLGAKTILDDEIAHSLGDGRKMTIQVTPTPYFEPIQTLV